MRFGGGDGGCSPSNRRLWRRSATTARRTTTATSDDEEQDDDCYSLLEAGGPVPLRHCCAFLRRSWNCLARWLDCQCPPVQSAPPSLTAVMPPRRDVCDRCRRYRYCHTQRVPISFLPRAVPCAEYAALRCRNGPAGSAARESRARPQRHRPCTELASCKSTASSPGFCSRRSIPATSHDSRRASTCAGDSALQISSRRIAPRGSTRARESLGAARPTRRPRRRADEATRRPPQRRRQRARAATHREPPVKHVDSGSTTTV